LPSGKRSIGIKAKVMCLILSWAIVHGEVVASCIIVWWRRPSEPRHNRRVWFLLQQFFMERLL